MGKEPAGVVGVGGEGISFLMGELKDLGQSREAWPDVEGTLGTPSR